jgi:hypothetical protein
MRIKKLLAIFLSFLLAFSCLFSGDVTALAESTQKMFVISPNSSGGMKYANVFVPLDFAAAMGLLLLINLMTGGKWFLSFVFPCLGGIALLVTAVVTLCRYLKKGLPFVFGGGFIALGCFMMLIEFFGHLTFGGSGFRWCFYPLGCCCGIGIFLLVVGCSSRLRDWLKRKLFI